MDDEAESIIQEIFGRAEGDPRVVPMLRQLRDVHDQGRWAAAALEQAADHATTEMLTEGS